LRESARLAGIDLNGDYDGEQLDGFARGQVNIDERGRRHSAARAYLHPVLHRSNLHLRTKANVTRVLIEQGCSVGVEFEREGQLQQVRARREVVLSGGTYHSPHILMLSGVGPAQHLQALGIKVVKDLPGVGGNLIEHPRMPLQFRCKQPISFLNQLRFDRAVMSVLRWAIAGNGPFANQICSGTVLLRSDAARDRPDIQLLCNPIRLDAALWFPFVKPAAEHSLYVTVCQLHAKSRGRVSLQSSDWRQAPKVLLNLFTEEADLANMRAGLRAARHIYAQSPLAELVEVETLPGANLLSDAELDQSIRELGGITHHPVGTCAMGVHPMAVVDPQLRVYGVKGLRVVDASVMPSIVSGNTNAATTMIAEKASELMLS
jgi:choline dehydrogenase